MTLSARSVLLAATLLSAASVARAGEPLPREFVCWMVTREPLRHENEAAGGWMTFHAIDPRGSTARLRVGNGMFGEQDLRVLELADRWVFLDLPDMRNVRRYSIARDHNRDGRHPATFEIGAPGDEEWVLFETGTCQVPTGT